MRLDAVDEFTRLMLLDQKNLYTPTIVMTARQEISVKTKNRPIDWTLKGKVCRLLNCDRKKENDLI